MLCKASCWLGLFALRCLCSLVSILFSSSIEAVPASPCRTEPLKVVEGLLPGSAPELATLRVTARLCRHSDLLVIVRRPAIYIALIQWNLVRFRLFTCLSWEERWDRVRRALQEKPHLNVEKHQDSLHFIFKFEGSVTRAPAKTSSLVPYLI